MKKSERALNEFLVRIFNDILKLEEKSLSRGEFKDLSITEVHTLEAIGLGEPKTMSELAAILEITPGTLSVGIRNLERKGYVKRVRNETDRRVVRISLEEKGKKAYRQHTDFHKNMIKEVLEAMSPEEEEVLGEALVSINNYFSDKRTGR